MKPTIGRIVHYTLTERDANDINRRRRDTRQHMESHRTRADGSQIHLGNDHSQGDVVPLMIVKVWGVDQTSYFNGQAFLDGCDTLWVTSTSLDPEAVPAKPGYCTWPPRV